jgi:ATP-dependent Lon protease
LTFHYVKEMSQVIDVALTKQKVKNAKKISWSSSADSIF